MIQLPEATGLALEPRARRGGRAGVRWRLVARAPLVTLAVAAAAGLVQVHGSVAGAGSIAAATGGAALISIR